MIVHIITGLKAGGAEGALYRLLTQNGGSRNTRVVSLTDHGVFGARIESLGIPVTCLKMSSSLPSPIKWLRLVRLLREWQPEVVQTWMYHADLFGGLAALVARAPVCWGIRHSDLTREGNKRSTLLVARMCAVVSRVVPMRAVSCSVRAVKVHQAFGYSVPFDVVPNGIDLAEWRPRRELRDSVRDTLGLSRAAFVFAHAGRSDPLKDHANLAHAFSSVHLMDSSVRLVLCGEGLSLGDAYFDSLPFSSQAKEAVIALGRRNDLARIWQSADAFVLSSSGEAFPNVVAEAMACGLPPVVTDVGDAAEIVGEFGKVVPPRDSESLAIAMREMMLIPEGERIQLGLDARSRVHSRFTLGKMAAGFERVWRSIIGESKRKCAD